MIEGLNKLINDAIREGAFPGANYCLWINGNKHFATFGSKALLPQVIENDLETIYDMASCTKVICTTTILYLLLQKGKIRLDDKVSQYLKDFKLTEITIWDLMTHTSGLPEMIPNARAMTREEIIAGMNNIKVTYERHTKIVYSDLGYIILGFVIESIMQQPLDKVAEEYIFIPLEMKNTSFCPTNLNKIAPTEKRKDYIDFGYVHDEVAKTLGGVAGHAGLFSNVYDISNFMEMILNDGIYKGKRFLSKAIVDLMFTPQVEEKDSLSLRTYKRGLGWILQGSASPSGDLCSLQTIMHTGFTGTHLFIDRINKVAFCLLTNRVHPSRENTKIFALRGKIGNYIMGSMV